MSLLPDRLAFFDLFTLNFYPFFIYTDENN